MGGAQSSGIFSGIPSAPTGKEFSEHAKTQEIKAMSDALFQFMYSTWDLREIFDITEKPGEYVIAISDLITSEFHVLGYTTKANKIGEIYFRKWEQLDPPQSASELQEMTRSQNVTRSDRLKKKQKRFRDQRINASRDEPGYKAHEQHSKIIAFYFVRIFQILGSLLLVIKDGIVPLVDEKTGDEISSKYAIGDRAYAQQGITLPRFRPVQGGTNQYGGAWSRISSTIPLGPFEFLRYYLRATTNDDMIKQYRDLGINLIIPEPDKGQLYSISDSLFFQWAPPNPLPLTIPIPERERGEKGRFYILVKSANKTIYELLYVDFKVIELGLSQGVKYESPRSMTKEQYRLFPNKVTIDTKDANGSSKIINASFVLTNLLKETNEYLGGTEYTLQGGTITDSIAGDNIKLDDIPAILEKYAMVAIARLKPGGAPYFKFTRKAIENSERNPVSRNKDRESSVAAPPIPSLAETFKALNNTDAKQGADGKYTSAYRHTPHCIARALTLLDVASINDIKVKGLDKAKVRICSSDINVAGLKYTGLKTIGQLYGKLKASDVINVDAAAFTQATKILDAFIGKNSIGSLSVSELNTAGQPDEAKDLSEALKRLSAAFNATSPNEAIPEKISDIQMYKPTRCKDTKDQELDKNRPVFQRLQGYSRQLLGFHLNNVINISKFLMAIFNVTQRPNGTWKVEGPKTEILFAGFSVLDQLTEQARALLIDYYSGCETIYQKGVKEWDNDINGPAENSNPVALPPVSKDINSSNPINPDKPPISSGPVTGGRRLI